MDTTLLFVLSIIITFGLFGFIIYFINNKFHGLQNNGQDAKKDEILMKWLENMNQHIGDVHFTVNQRLMEVQGTVDERLKHVQNQMYQSSDSLNKRVDLNSQALNERLDQASQVISNVHKELGSMSEIGRGMKDLQDFLKSPKLRGNIGEEILKDLLEQMIPSESYTLQHKFRTGDIVDALLKVDEGFICVDSKFPMENFNAMMSHETQADRDASRKEFIRNVKKHIDDISRKYILPSEGTLDFALMYIPSEAIYYEVVVNSNEQLGKYAWSKKVLPVSPNVFYSYLKAILIGLEGKKVESKAKEILTAIKGIKEESIRFSESLRVMSSHLNNAKNKSDEVTNVFDKISNKISTLANIKIVDQNTKVITIDEPEMLDVPEDSDPEPLGS